MIPLPPLKRTNTNKPNNMEGQENKTTASPIDLALGHVKIAKRVVQWALQRKRSDDDRACYIDGMRDAGVNAKAVSVM